MHVSWVPAFRDNYIWILHGPRDAARVAVVDPGDAAPVIRAVDEHGWQPDCVLATHHHRDHTGGIAELAERYGVPVYGPAHEHIDGLTRGFGTGDRLERDRAGFSLRALDIPGHTAGHIAFEGHGAVFCGDTLFSAGCGRLFEGTPGQMFASLGRLAALPPGTRVYCGHEYTLANLEFALTVEPENAAARRYRDATRTRRQSGEPSLPTSIGLETEVNPFLRCHEPAVAAAAEAHAGTHGLDTVGVFAAIREWKDHF